MVNQPIQARFIALNAIAELDVETSIASQGALAILLDTVVN